MDVAGTDLDGTDLDGTDLETARRRVEANGLSFPVVDAGKGPVVLLLHGFPDSADLWCHQVPALVDAGYRVVAPDLGGFGRSDRPEGVTSYAVPLILADVLEILDVLEVERASVVAHDWGAAIGWIMASLVADRVERLAALSVGHPASLRTAGMRQRELSWYMLFFQHEGIAEEALSRDDWALFRAWSRGDGDAEHNVADLARPGALTAGLNWYRANVAPASYLDEPLALPLVTCPVLGMWSDGDHYLTEEAMTGSAAHVAGKWRYQRVEGASHWLPLDAPDRVNELLLGFLGS